MWRLVERPLLPSVPRPEWAVVRMSYGPAGPGLAPPPSEQHNSPVETLPDSGPAPLPLYFLGTASPAVQIQV